MSQSLEMTKLIDEYGMPQVQVWCSWVKPSLNSEWQPLFQLLDQLTFH